MRKNLELKVKLTDEQEKKITQKIEGYYKEAQGDMSINQNYTASAVFGRIKNIKEAFLADLKEFSKEIEL